MNRLIHMDSGNLNRSSFFVYLKKHKNYMIVAFVLHWTHWYFTVLYVSFTLGLYNSFDLFLFLFCPFHMKLNKNHSYIIKPLSKWLCLFSIPWNMYTARTITVPPQHFLEGLTPDPAPDYIMWICKEPFIRQILPQKSTSGRHECPVVMMNSITPGWRTIA